MLQDNPQQKQVNLPEWEEIVREKHGIPREAWNSLSKQESGDNVNAVSPTGVRGKYQVTERTARGYGLDRNDPYQQVVAAAKHFKAQYDTLGHIQDDRLRWTGAYAKYYGGDDAVKADGTLSTGSKDQVSTPAKAAESYAKKLGNELRKSSGQVQPSARPAQPNPFDYRRPALPLPGQPQEYQKLDKLQLSPGAVADRNRTQRAVQQERSRFQARNPVAQYIERALTQDLSQAAELGQSGTITPAAREDLRIRRIAQGLPEPQVPGTAEEVINRFGRGAANLLATVPEGAAEIIDSAVSRLPRNPGTYGQPSRDIKLAPKVRPLTDLAQRGAEIAAPVDPNNQSFLTSTLPQAAGSAAGFGIGAALAPRAMAKRAAGYLGAASNAQQIAREIDQAAPNADPATRAQAVIAGAGAGATESLGLGGRMGQLADRILTDGSFRKLVAGVASEAGQEYGQDYLNDLIARYIGTYDPQRSLHPLEAERVKSALAGAVLGGAFGGVEMVAARSGQEFQQKRQARANIADAGAQMVANRQGLEALAQQPATNPQPAARNPQQPAPTMERGDVASAAALLRGGVPSAPAAATRPARPARDNQNQQRELARNAAIDETLKYAESRLALTDQGEWAGAAEAARNEAAELGRFAGTLTDVAQRQQVQRHAAEVAAQARDLEGLATMRERGQRMNEQERQRQERETQARMQRRQVNLDKAALLLSNEQKRYQAELAKRQQAEQQAGQTGPLQMPSRLEQLRMEREARRSETATSAENTALDASERRAEAERRGDLKTVVAEWDAEVSALRDRQKVAQTSEERSQVARALRNALTERSAVNERLKVQLRDEARRTNAPTVGLPGERPARPQRPQRSERLLGAVENESGGVPKVPTAPVNFGRLAEQEAERDYSAEEREGNQSLESFVVSQGGAKRSKNNRGDAAYGIGREGGRPGFINDESGVSIDQLREQANEAGFGPYESEADFLLAMRDARNVFSARRRMTDQLVDEEAEYYRNRYEQEQLGQTENQPTAATEPAAIEEAAQQSVSAVSDQINKSQRVNGLTPDKSPTSRLLAIEKPQSPYARLLLANQAEIDRLHDLPPGSPEAAQILAGLRSYAQQNGIEPRHVGALVDAVRNYQSDRAKSQNLRDAAGPRWRRTRVGNSEPLSGTGTTGRIRPEMGTLADEAEAALTALRRTERESQLPRTPTGELGQAPENLAPISFDERKAFFAGMKPQELEAALQALEARRNETIRRSDLDDEQRAEIEREIGRDLQAANKQRHELVRQNLLPAKNEKPESGGTFQKRKLSREELDRFNEALARRDNPRRGLDTTDLARSDSKIAPTAALRSSQASPTQAIQPSQSQPSPADFASVARAMYAEAPAAEGRALVSLANLRQRFPGVSKEEFDNAILEHARRDDLALHWHDYPSSLTEQERAAMVYDLRAEKYYLGAAFVDPKSLRVQEALKGQVDTGAGAEPRTVSHENPAIDGQPVLAETADGRVVVPNPDNKGGVSVVKDQKPKQGGLFGETEPQPAKPERKRAVTEAPKGAEAIPAADANVRADADTLLRVLSENGGEMQRAKLVREAMLVNSRSVPALELLKKSGEIYEKDGVIRAKAADEVRDILGGKPAAESNPFAFRERQWAGRRVMTKDGPGVIESVRPSSPGSRVAVVNVQLDSGQIYGYSEETIGHLLRDKETATTPKQTGVESAQDETVRADTTREGSSRPVRGDDRAGRVAGRSAGDGDSVSGRGTEPRADNRGKADRAGKSTRSDEPAVETADARTESQQPAAAAKAPDYTITDLEAAVPTGKVGKLRANLAAIRLWQQITAEGRTATPEEQAILAQYTGWGQFPDLFNEHNDAGKKLDAERADLKAMLTSEEFDAARKSTLNAHYTSPEVVRSMWQIADRLGFKGGRVLEPSMGIGNFFGLMPTALRAKSRLVGVELDRITGGMARLLYPSANVQVKGFEKHQMPDGFYDLVIGNVPFGDYRVHDPAYNKHRANIHDYFILKSLDKVRPGGIVSVITSTGTLDKSESRLRRAMAERADLIAAVRFPEGAFEKNAGTQVVTDLLIFRKRKPGEKANDAWVELGKLPDADGGADIPISNYYAQNPEMILGRLDRKGTMYGRSREAMHVSRTDDFAERLVKAMQSMPEGVMGKAERAAQAEKDAEAVGANEKMADGALVVRGNKVLRRRGDQLVEEAFDKAEAERISKLLALRDILAEITQAQLKGENTRSVRQRLNYSYDAFVKKYGALRKKTNAKLLKDDPSSYLVLALEDSYDAKTGKTVKAAIFEKDVIQRARGTEEANTPAEALAVSLYEGGTLDLQRVAELLKTTEEEAASKLVEQGLGYQNPSGGWETAEKYLSGNVRRKLLEAQEAAQADARFWSNVKALEAVQPADIDTADITVKMGASWVPAEDIVNFAAHLMQARADEFRVAYVPSSGTWIAGYSREGERLYGATQAKEVYGTPRANFIEILNAALNDKPVKVFDVDSNKNSVLNVEETEKAALKMQEVREAFNEWVWTEPERAQRLHRYYNDNFNNLRLIEYKGEHYKNAEGKFILPGMNPAIQLRPHQVKDVWQAVSNGKLLDASEVGAGKTFIMGAIAMEWRRLGLARKPAVVVPKSRIAPTVTELQTLYPAAKILSFASNFDKDNRRQTTANLATGDYDMVVLTHDQFAKLQMRPEYVEQWINRELEEIDQRIKDVNDEFGEKDRTGNRIVKQLEKVKARVEAKLKDALDGIGKDDVINFEDTGIDALLVDEAHAFKSLPVYSRRQDLKGVPKSRSERATNMFMVSRWLMENNGGKGIVFATGTPVSNTLAELYNMQRYLQYEELTERGIENFDAWADLFTEASTNFEYKATGEYAAVTRLTDFVNIPELQTMVRQVMATNFVDDMPWVTRPKKKEELISVDMSPAQEDFLKIIRQRAEALKKMTPKERKESRDNFLVLSTDARKSALSSKLVNPHAEGDDGKITAAVNKVMEIHKARPEVAQMIFLDMGISPTRWGYSVYDDIINRLVIAGIPKNKIANFSLMSDKQREAAAEKLNKGEYLIGIGSSWKMGTGINAQKRLAAMHHLDTHWVPAYLEQRNGRGHRQGNLNDPNKPADKQEVQAYYYTTKGSFDLVMWQAVVRKLKGINQFMKGEVGRTMRMDETGDEDSGELSFDTIMAATSDNPYEMDRIRLQQDTNRLERQERNWRSQHSRLRNVIQGNGQRLPGMRSALANFDKDVAQYESTKGGKFSVKIGKETYDKRDVAGNQLAIAYVNSADYQENKLGEYRGFEIWGNKSNDSIYLKGAGPRHTFNLALSDPQGVFNSADANLRQIANRRQELADNIEQFEKDIKSAEVELAKPFKRAEEFKAARQKLAEIEQKIKDHQNKGKVTETSETAVEPASEAQPDATAKTSTDGVEYRLSGFDGPAALKWLKREWGFTRGAVKETAAEFARIRKDEGIPRALKFAGAEALNTARAVQLSLDIPILRQGGMLNFNITRKDFWQGQSLRRLNAARSAWSDVTFPQAKQALENLEMPVLGKPVRIAHLAHLAGVDFTSDLFNKQADRKSVEEGFESRIGRNLPVIRNLEQFNAVYMDLRRMDVFRRYLDNALKGREMTDEQMQKVLADAATMVNLLSGRADVQRNADKSERLTPTNLLLKTRPLWMSAQYLSSRLRLLNPGTYARLEPKVRQAALRDVAGFAAFAYGAAALAALAGAAVSLDPDDSDFMKIKFGDTRYDFIAGMGPILRLFWQLGKAGATTVKDEVGGQSAAEVRRDTANEGARFLRGKLGALPSLGVTWWNDWTEITGEKVTVSDAVLSRVTPLMLQDAKKAIETEDKTALVKLAPALVGAGVQQYENPRNRSRLVLQNGLPQRRELSVYDRTFGVRSEKGETKPAFEARRKRYEALAKPAAEGLGSSTQYQGADAATRASLQRSLNARLSRMGKEEEPARPSKLTPATIFNSVRQNQREEARKKARRPVMPRQGQ